MFRTILSQRTDEINVKLQATESQGARPLDCGPSGGSDSGASLLWERGRFGRWRAGCPRSRAEARRYETIMRHHPPRAAFLTVSHLLC